MLSPMNMRFPLKRRVVPLPYNHVSLDVEDDQGEMEESTEHEDPRKCIKEDSKSSKIPVKKKKKCSFVNCGSNSQNHSELKFFRFPRSNYKEWIAASGCDKLNTVKEGSLYTSYFVCSKHFRLTDCKKILSPSKTDAALKSDVVPLPFDCGNPRMEAERSDVQSSPEKAKTPQPASKKAKTRQPASKKSKTSQSSTCGNPSICLPDSSPACQTTAESTSQTSQSIINISYQNFSLQYGNDSSTNNSADVFLRDVKREDCEQTLPNFGPDQTQGTVFSCIQEQNNQNCVRSLPFFAPKKPTLTPLLSDLGDEKSCSKVANGSEDDDEFYGGDEIFSGSFVDEEENQMCIDDKKSDDKTDDRAIERRTSSCSKQGSEAESSSKEKVQMHHGSEFEPDDREVASDASTSEFDEKYSPVPNPSLCDKEGTSSSQSTKVVEDNSVNSKESAGEGSILSTTSSVGAAGEGGPEKLDVIATAAAMAGVTTSSVVSVSTPIITAGKGCTTVAKISSGSFLFSASPPVTEVQLFLRLPNEQTIPVKVPVATLMSASSMPSPSPLCLPPPVQQVVELPQQAASKLSVSDVPPARDPLTGHQPGPPSAASSIDAPEGPTNDCSSKPQKGKKRKRRVSASPSEDDEETKKMKDLERKRVATEKRRQRRQKQREGELKIAPQIAQLTTANSRLESEVASLKAEVTSMKDLLLQHMACPAPLAPTVRGANPVVIAAPNPVVGTNRFVVAATDPVVVAAEGPKVAVANPSVVAAGGPKVAGSNRGVVAAEGPKVAEASPSVVAAEGRKVAEANPVVVAAEGSKVAAANPGEVAVEGPNVATVRPGRSFDPGHQLKPRTRSILPITSKPAPTTFLLFTFQRKAAT